MKKLFAFLCILTMLFQPVSLPAEHDHAAHAHAEDINFCEHCGDVVQATWTYVDDTTCHLVCPHGVVFDTMEHEWSDWKLYEGSIYHHYKECIRCKTYQPGTSNEHTLEYQYRDEATCAAWCSVCQLDVFTYFHAWGDHTLGEDGVTMATCGYCGYEAPVVYNGECQHDLDETDRISNNEHTHSTYCRLCQTYVAAEAHTWTKYAESGYTHSKVCEECGYTSTVREPHNFVLTGDQDQYGNPYYQCEDCLYSTTISADPNTCEHPYTSTFYGAEGMYNVCNWCYTTTEPVAHEHTWNNGYQYNNSSVDAGHWDSCSVCGLPSAAQDHVWSDAYYNDNIGHYRFCTVCNISEPVARHTWSDALVDTGSGHAYVCTVCNYTNHATYADHSYDDSQYVIKDSTHAYHCTVCDLDVHIGLHNWSTPYLKDDGQVYHNCPYCDYEALAPYADTCEHQWKPDTYYSNGEAGHSRYCMLCNIYEPTQEHVFTTYNGGNPGHHESVCSLCGYQGNPEAHTHVDFGVNEYGHAQKKCTVCENVWVFSSDPETCEHNNTSLFPTEENHQTICYDCGTVLSVEAHTPDNYYNIGAYDTTYHYTVCSVCGYAGDLQEHVWGENMERDSTGHRHICSLCNAYEALQPHTWSEDLKDDGYGHAYQCTECGAFNNLSYQDHTYAEDYSQYPYTHATHCTVCDLDIETSYHSWGAPYLVDGVQMHKCNECEYEAALIDPASCTHVWRSETPESFAQAGHARYCIACLSYESVQAHTFGDYMPGNQLGISANVHARKCSGCDYVERGLAHTAVVSEADENGNITITCSVCKDSRSVSQYEYDNHNCEDWYDITGDAQQHQIICCTCLKVISSEDHTWSDNYSSDGVQMNGHYRYCTRCGMHDVTEDHVWNSGNDNSGYFYNDETHYQFCEICGYSTPSVYHTFGAELDLIDDYGHATRCTVCGYRNSADYTEHTLSDEMTITAYSHSTYCTVCEETVTINLHSYSSPYTDEETGCILRRCEECGYVSDMAYPGTCEHVFVDGLSDYFESTHYHSRRCALCLNYVNATAHSFTTDEDGSYNQNMFGHWLECSECGMGQSYTAHTFTLPEDGVYPAYVNCTVCGYQHYMEYGPDDHNHEDYMAGHYYINGDQHERVCTMCHATILSEDHTWGEYFADSGTDGEGHYKTCIYCDAKSETEAHIWDDEYHSSSPLYGHYRICTVCNDYSPYQAHTFSKEMQDLNDGRHGRICSVCGEAEETSLGDHQVTGDYVQFPFTHAQHCSVCDLDVYAQKHDWDTPYHDENGDYVHRCYTCGYIGQVVDPATCEHEWADDSYSCDAEGHARLCIRCRQYETTYQPHIWGAASDNGNTHMYWCTVCGTGSISYFHNPVPGDGEYVGNHCSECGHPADAEQDACEHVFSIEGESFYEETENGHAPVCIHCWTRGEETAHVYGVNWFANTEGHYHECIHCGAKGEITEHRNEDYNGNSLVHEKYCIDCGYGSTPETHTWSDGLVPVDDSAHAYQCTVCGYTDSSTFAYHSIEEERVITEYTHAWHCSVCDHDVNVYMHEWSSPYEDENGALIRRCYSCDYTAPVQDASTCEHVWEYSDYDAAGTYGHYRICAVCSAASEVTEHIWTTKPYQDNETHWQHCTVCGFDATREPHVWSETVGDRKVCTVCGNLADVTPGDCDHYWNSYAGVEGGHVQICAYCRTTSEVTDHVWRNSYDYSEIDSIGHWQQCEYCNTHSEPTTHTWEENYTRNSAAHWLNCTVCGAGSEMEPHTWSDTPVNDNNGGHAIICTTCGYHKDNSWNVHQTQDELIVSEYYHSTYCTVCDSIAENTPHNWGVITEDENGVRKHQCLDCEYVGTVIDFEDCDHPVFEGGYYTNGLVGHWRFCLACRNYTPAQAHIPDPNYSNEGPYHQTQCSVCHVSLEPEAHVYGEGVVDEWGNTVYTCTVCDAQTLVNGGEECQHEWSYFYTVTDEGHQRACMRCWALEELEAHTWDENNFVTSNEAHMVSCTVCGTLSEPEDHIWNDSYSWDDNGHSRYCSVCGNGERRQLHTWSDEMQMVDDYAHARKCTVCSAVDHSTYAQHDISDTYESDAYYHWYSCSGCDGKLYSNFHIWRNEFTNEEGVLQHVCEDCGRIEDVIDPETCEHQYDTRHLNHFGDQGHSFFCYICQTYPNMVPHEFGRASSNETCHFYQCNVCFYETDYEPHDLQYLFDDEGNIITVECETCDAYINYVDPDTCEHELDTSAYLDSEDGHANVCRKCWKFVTSDHNWGSEYFYETDEGHYNVCLDCQKCGELEPHVPEDNYSMDPDVHFFMCTVCNSACYEEEHTWSEDFQPVPNSDHHAIVCTECGREKDDTEEYHTESDQYVSTEYEHTMLCSVCGGEMYTNRHSWNGSYTDENGVRLHDCYDCGYTAEVVDPATCEHVWDEDMVYWDDHYHWKECLICQKQTERTEHSYNGDYEYGSFAHASVCADCGHQEFVEPHTAGTPFEDEDGNWYVSCIYCNYTTNYVAPEDCPHNNISSIWYETENGHAHTCYDCWELVNEESHEWNPNLASDSVYHYNYCNYCSAKNNVTEHTLSDSYGTNDEIHNFWCTACYASINPEPHTWSDGYMDFGNRHAIGCTVCGTEKNGTDEYHEYTDEWVIGKYTHSYYCTICELNIYEGYHSYGSAFEGEDGTMLHTCFECGYTSIVIDPETCEHEWKENHHFVDDNGHALECYICNGISEIQPHTYRDEYYYSDTVHFHQCSVCGKNTEEEVHSVDHTETSSDGTVISFCICGKQTVMPQEGACEHEWDNSYIRTEEGHAQFCTVCWTQGEVVAHTPRDYKSSDNEYHFQRCTVCNMYYDYEEHTWSEEYDGFYDGHTLYCTDCYRQKEVLPHIWKEKPEPSNNGHSYSCSVCNYRDSESEEAHDIPEAYTVTEYKHSKRCTVCGMLETEGLHNWNGIYTNADGEQVHDCIDCGYTGKVVDPTECEHVPDEHKYSTNHEGHSTVCMACRKSLRYEPHVSDGQYYHNQFSHMMRCVECGSVFNQTAHTPVLEEENGVSRYRCSVCHAIVNVDPECEHDWNGCEYVQTDDGKHAPVCNLCAAIGEAVDHIWSTDYDSHVDGHYHYCVECYKPGELIGHTYGDRVFGDDFGHYAICTECHHAGTYAKHNVSEDYRYHYSAHYKYCTDCGMQLEEEAHDFPDEFEYSAAEHWLPCSVCEYKRDKSEHMWGSSYVNEDGENVHDCFECGQTLPVVAFEDCVEHFVSKYSYFDDDYHYTYCVICEGELSKEEHTMGYEVFDNVHSYICENCPFGEWETYHSVASIETLDDGTVVQLCACGYAIPQADADTCDHELYGYYYIDEHGHKAYCNLCWQLGELEAHERSAEDPEWCIYCDSYLGEEITLSILQQPEDVTVYEGDIAEVTVLAEGDGLTYTWYYANAGTDTFIESAIITNTYAMEMNEMRNGRRIYCVVTDQYGNSIGSNIATISMATTLEIIQQPVDTEVAEGEMVEVTVKANGDELTYQWFYANAGSSTFTASSTVTDTYAMEMNEMRDGRRIYCVITDKYGTFIRTKTVTISMRSALEITQQPKDVYVAVGKTASVALTAVGEGLTYEWYWKNEDAADYQLSSVTTDTYTTQMTADKAGRTVYCVITDSKGNSVTSDVATLHVIYVAQITSQPKDAAVKLGDTVSVSLAASGDGITYQWYWKNADQAAYQPSSSTGNTYSTGMTEEKDGRTVYCVITDKYGNSVTSDVATLSILTSVQITGQPASVSVKNGATASTSVTAEGEGLTYQWYWKNADQDVYLLSSASGDTYSTAMSEEKDGRTVYCVITDKHGNSVTSDVATLSLLPSVKITRQPANVSVKNGATASTSVAATGDGLTYEWYWKNADQDAYLLSSITINTYSTGMTAEKDGRTVYCVITDKYGNSVTSDVATLSILPSVKITKQPASVSVKNGATASTSVTATGDGLTYKWYWKNADMSAYNLSSITINTYSTGMSAEKDGRTVYCVITDKYGNTVTSDVATLNIASGIVISKQPSNVTVKNGATASTSVTATGDGLTYAWYWKNADMSAYKLSSITINTYSTGMSAEKDGRTVYCVITDKHGNTVTSDVATLNIASDIVISKQPGNVTVKNGATASTSVTATGDGLTYAWYWKNADMTAYKLSSVTINTYSTAMSAEKDGRTVYCVITDKHGNTVTSNVATLSISK